MIPVTIQCGCGQAYRFEVEPVDGRMPGTVVCPTCGVDGTVAANEAIAQSAAQQALAAETSKSPLHLAKSAHSNLQANTQASARGGTTLQHWQTDRTQAKFEARARISWGDSSQTVLGYLMTQGFSREEASELVGELARERALIVRGKGIKNIFAGSGLVLLPIVSFVVFWIAGAIPVKIFGFMIAGALYGIWLIIHGCHLLIVPKSEGGDVAEK